MSFEGRGGIPDYTAGPKPVLDIIHPKEKLRERLNLPIIMLAPRKAKLI